MTGMRPILELHNIARFYVTGDTEVRALDDVSLNIWPGEFVAIMGQSGSGKSTLMNIIGCLDRPNAGTYHVNGIDVAGLTGDELAALRRDTFGFVFQRYNLLATGTAEENVEMPAIYAGLDKPARVARARELLAKLGLGTRIQHRPSELSGGQQQRVAIARALVNNPPIILADEPTGALDSRSGTEVMALLKELHAEGRTVILITHDENVAKNAKRVIRLSDGKIVSTQGDELVREDAATIHEATGRIGVTAEVEEATKMAMRALKVNIFRTALTLLGIVIGVASVVVMLAVGNGSKQRVLNQISGMGANVLSIRPGAPGVRNSGDNATLVMEDAEAIKDVPNVAYVVPERTGRMTVRYENIDAATSVQGEGVDFPAARDWPVAYGSFYSERDQKSIAPVIVLGSTVANELFGNGADAIGQYVLVKNVPFEVIGVMSSKGAGPMGNDMDDAVYVPVTTAITRLFGRNYLSGISISVVDVKQIDATQNKLTALLKERHHAENFSIRNSASILETVTTTQNTLTALLGSVAAISLLVGGIGVMNIMLVSVTERTREIGIRMATGARERDIMLQFNIEAAVVCTFGGVLGVAIGFAVGTILELFGVQIAFSALPAIFAFACAVGTGLLFGYLPAKKAAALDPVVALASE